MQIALWRCGKMGILSLAFGVISTIWALIGGSWIAAAIGVLGAVLGLFAVKKNVICAGMGLLLSVNGAAWGLLSMVYELGIDPIAELFGLG